MGIKHWKEASTLILTSLKSAVKKEPYDYAILTLKRSARNVFMPGRHVFPGGGVDSSDCDKKWLQHFSQFSFFQLNERFPVDNRPDILNNKSEEMPKSISLRITAIRETFEETGILLCKDHKNTSICESPAELESWRLKVNKNGNEFFNLCQNFNCYPDIFSLQLWSNWLTPRNDKKRYDTIFFIAGLNEMPDYQPDNVEVETTSWHSPNELISLSKDREIWLAPPQVYEICRLCHFKNLRDLCEFSSKRSKEGCERWMPEQVKTLDGMVSLLPGDESYNPDGFNSIDSVRKVDKTNEEFRFGVKILHRIEHKNNFDKIVINNYEQKYQHVAPIT